MHRLSLDSETYLLAPGIAAPRMVCLTTCDEDGDTNLLLRDDAIPLLHDLFDAGSGSQAREADKIEFVLHHARFDMAVFAAADPRLLPKIVRLYDEGRVRCTMVREKLLALARGELADEGETGAKRNIRFGLDKCILRRFEIDLSADKATVETDTKGKVRIVGDADSWRLRYAELDGVPVERWPEKARQYALDDARWNLALFDDQTRELRAEGGQGDAIPDEAAQTRAAFWLYLMSVRGVRTDPVAVNRLATRVRAEYERMNAIIRAADVLRPQMKKGEMVWTKNMAALRARVTLAYGGQPPMTGGGKKERKDGTKAPPAVSTEREVLTSVADPEIMRWVGEFEHEIVDARANAGLPDLTPDEMAAVVRDVSVAAAEHFDGRLDARTGFPIDADTIYNWLVLHAVGERSGVEKVLTTYVPVLQQGTQGPICCKFNELVASGRGSSYEPNLQNPPRKGGIRECFVPRPGHVFALCDYSFIELVTLAQTCLDLFGWSTLADAINAGLDPHLDMAASDLGISYAEAERRLRAGDPEVSEQRQRAKCFHPDTEVLTQKGWQRIADLDGSEEVAAAEPSPGGGITLRWERPTMLTRREAPELVHLLNKGIDLRVTPDHRMLAFEATPAVRGRRWRTGDPSHLIGNPKVVQPEDFPTVRYFPSAGVLDEGDEGNERTERMVRLAVATQADGHYRKNGDVALGFTKRRKIERLRSLLHPEEYVESVTTQGVTLFVLTREFSADVRAFLDPDKTIPWWWLGLSLRLRIAALDEVQHWDSYTGSHRADGKKEGPGIVRATLYSTTIRKNADVLQAIGVLSGQKSRLSLAQEREGTHASAWRLSIKRGHLTRGGNVACERAPYGGEVVCLSVPSSFVVVRDGGVPVVTGQCRNFGFPGGLGAATYVAYARGYGLNLTEAEARQEKEKWFSKWPEMRVYYDHHGRLTLGDRLFDLVQLPTGRVRGQVGFCDGCNSHFQGRAADGIKRAGWYATKECYLRDPYPDGVRLDSAPTGEVVARLHASLDGRASPLLGSYPVLFLHDELIIEAPEERAAEAVKRLSAVMIEGMREVVPDVIVKTESALCRRWYKGAKPLFDASGRMIPWEPRKRAA